MNERAVPPIITPPRKKRRWWLWALLGVAVAVVLGIALIVTVAAYWNSLIVKYAESRPATLPAVDASPAAREQLTTKWAAFQKSVEANRPTAALKLSAAELNAFLANIPGLADRFRLVIHGDTLQGLFTIPLEKPGQPKLKGKHLNGVVTLRLGLREDGFPELRVTEALAHGQPIPTWLLRRLQRENFLKELEKNPELSTFLQNLDSIQVKDSFVVFQPRETI